MFFYRLVRHTYSMVDTILFLTVILGVMGILLGLPFLLVKITKWESIEAHWWPITSSFLYKHGRVGYPSVLTGAMLFYGLHLLALTQLDPNPYDAKLGLMLVFTGIFSMIKVCGKAILVSRIIQTHLFNGLVILAIVTYLRNSFPECSGTFRFITLVFVNYLNLRLIVLSALSHEGRENA